MTLHDDRNKLLSQDHNELIYKMLIEDAHSVRSAAAAFTDVAYLDGVLTPLFEEEASSEFQSRHFFRPFLMGKQ